MLFTLSLLFICIQAVVSFHRVCYLTIDHRPFEFTDQENGFQGDLCTHVNVMPVSVDGEGSVFPRKPDDVQKYAKVQELRLLNPDIKLLITLIVTPGTVFSDAVRDVHVRKTFARNALTFIREYGFDGIDIDWEFPVFSSWRWQDKENFVSLLQEIRYLIDTEAANTLLSVAVAADPTIIVPGYDAVGINSSVDYINLMSYDYTDWHWYYCLFPLPLEPLIRTFPIIQVLSSDGPQRTTLSFQFRVLLQAIEHGFFR